MTIRRTAITTVFAFCSAFCILPSVLAEEVQWRTEYVKARQEALEKGRPLVIDLGTENCFWCKQLDQRTFKDPGIAALLNEQCVPLRIDAERSPGLAQALQIQTFPTLVFAAPDGRILGYQEGFLEAPRLKEHLQRTLAAVTPPDWMTRDYEDAVKAHAAADHVRAAALLKNVLDDGKDRPIQAKARQLLADLEQQAAAKYARAKQLVEKGQNAEAVEAVTELVRTYSGTQAARDGSLLLNTLTAKSEVGEQQRGRRARDLLSQAREDYRMQQFLCCLDRCETLMSQFSDLPEGSEASQLAAEIKSNPEWTKRVCDELGERLSALYLSLAETWLKKGQPQQAVFYLERVVQNFPNSRHAEAAQVRLSQIQGQPPRTIDFKK
jgi:thioredoxin-like negative regulator of GroEL